MDPRVRRTRKLLQDAFSSLVYEKRFSAMSVQDIAERATVNRATFYAHYVDKEDLARNVLKTDFHAAVMHRFTERPALSYENIVEFAVGVFEWMGKMHESCPETAAELQDTVGKVVQQELYSLMELWVSASRAYQRLFPGCAKETVVTALSWTIYGGAHRWSSSDRKIPPRQICRGLVSILVPNHDAGVTASAPRASGTHARPV
jgi:AcrR family transcriptional regulator